MFRVQYLENSWRCYLATIANYYLVRCEAVRSAVLATAWLLVLIVIKIALCTLNWFALRVSEVFENVIFLAYKKSYCESEL